MQLTEIEQVLASLISIPSITGDREAADAVFSYVRNELSPLGLHIEEYDDDGFGVQVVSTHDTKEPDIMLIAHADVVPASTELFVLRHDGDRLYGRGVWDMKAALAAYIILLKQLADESDLPSLAIAVTTDEETRNQNVNFLLEQGYRPKCAVLPDGSSDWNLEAGAKGAWTIRVSVEGKAAHGSRPWDGDSATQRLLVLLNEIVELFDGQRHETDTLNIAQLEGGQAQNQVAVSAAAILDIRLRDQASLERCQQRISALVARHNAQCEEMVMLPPLEHDLHEPHAEAFAQSIRAVMGRDPTQTVSLGASDAARFIAAGIPCIVTRPEGGGHHADDEWIGRESLAYFVPILKHFVFTANALTERVSVPLRQSS